MATKSVGSVGRTDRALRLVLAIVLLGFAFFCPWAAELGQTVQLVSGVVGAVLGLTAIVSFCPLYRILGICTA